MSSYISDSEDSGSEDDRGPRKNNNSKYTNLNKYLTKTVHFNILICL